MNVDLACNECRVELGFNCDDEGAALAVFERLKAMLGAGAIVLQLSMPDGSAPLLEVDDEPEDVRVACLVCGALCPPEEMDGDDCVTCAEDAYDGMGLPL